MHSRQRKGSGWGRLFSTEDLDDAERTDPNMEIPEGRLKLPAPETDANARPEVKLEIPAPAPGPVKPTFDSDELMDKLDPLPDRAAKKAKRGEGTLLTKEVVLTVAAGLVLLAGAFAYNWYDNQQAAEAVAVPVPVVEVPKKKAPTPPPPPVAQPTPKVEAAVAAQPKIRKAAVSIVSILSAPTGATVEIDGTIYGKTPLIEKLSNGPQSLRIRLMKDNYKKFETVIMKNEAGHYNLNARMEPAARR